MPYGITRSQWVNSRVLRHHSLSSVYQVIDNGHQRSIVQKLYEEQCWLVHSNPGKKQQWNMKSKLKLWELSWCQFSCNKWHSRLQFWQPVIPPAPMMVKLTSCSVIHQLPVLKLCFPLQSWNDLTTILSIWQKVWKTVLVLKQGPEPMLTLWHAWKLLKIWYWLPKYAWTLHFEIYNHISQEPARSTLYFISWDQVRFCGLKLWLTMLTRSVLWLLIPRGTSNTLRLRQNGRHFTDDILKRILSFLFNKNVWMNFD